MAPTPAIEFTLAWSALGLLLGLHLAREIHHDLETEPTARRPVAAANAVATALAFAVLAHRLGPHHALGAASLLAAAGIPIAVIDATQHRIPTRLVAPTTLAVGATLAINAVFDNNDAVIRAGVAMLTVTGLFLLIAIATNGALGTGDIRLVAPIGLVLGWNSWTALAQGTTLMFVYGAATAALRLANPNRHKSLPFAPAMLAGGLTSILWNTT